MIIHVYLVRGECRKPMEAPVPPVDVIAPHEPPSQIHVPGDALRINETTFAGPLLSETFHVILPLSIEYLHPILDPKKNEYIDALIQD